MNLNFTIQSEDNNKSIKEFLKQNNVSARLLFKLRKNNCIFCNGSSCEVSQTIFTGDQVTIDLNYPEDNSNVVPADISLDIIYEDDHFLVINKGSNIAIHPSMLHYSNSLSNGVKFYFDKIGLFKKIRPVNRLDRDTSRVGCVC